MDELLNKYNDYLKLVGCIVEYEFKIIDSDFVRISDGMFFRVVIYFLANLSITTFSRFLCLVL